MVFVQLKFSSCIEGRPRDGKYESVPAPTTTYTITYVCHIYDVTIRLVFDGTVQG